MFTIETGVLISLLRTVPDKLDCLCEQVARQEKKTHFQ